MIKSATPLTAGTAGGHKANATLHSTRKPKRMKRFVEVAYVWIAYALLGLACGLALFVLWVFVVGLWAVFG